MILNLKPYEFSRIFLIWVSLVVTVVWYSAVLAQPPGSVSGVGQPDRPGDERPQLPDYLPETPQPGLTLPPVPPPPQKESDISSAPRIFIRELKIVGNTAFDAEELKKITAPHENKALSFEDLEALRHRLTLFYVNNGYITSGAVIPDQKVENGAVTFQIIEGKLSDIEISTSGRLRPRYVESRLRLGADAP